MPAVGAPLGDIAGQIVKAPCIGLEATRRGHAPVAIAVADEGVVPGTAAGRDVVATGEVAGVRRRHAGIAPWVAPRVAGAQGVLELGLAGQPVMAPGLLRRRSLCGLAVGADRAPLPADRKSTRLNSSHVKISYAVFCLKKKKNSTKERTE